MAVVRNGHASVRNGAHGRPDVAQKAAMTRRLHVLGAIVLGVACTETRSPVAPSSPAAASSSAAPVTFTLTGVVYEATAAGRRPLARVGLDVSVEYQSWPPRVFSDATGRYRVPNTSLSGPLKIIAEIAGYKQPCRVAVVQTDADQDLYLVPDDTLSTTGMPASLPLAGAMLTGHVFERSPEGIQRLPGASIVLDFSGGLGWGPVASTVTDATGGYVLCNMGSPVLGIYAYVSKPGYRPAYLLVRPGQTGSFEIELERQSTAD
jgi:hypothetical protein